MKKIIKSTSLLSAAFIASGLFVSCDDEKQLTLNAEEAIMLKEITINCSEILKLPVGMDSTLVYTYGPKDVTNSDVYFTSSDESVVTVDANGTLHGVKVGTASITALSALGFKVYDAEAVITVEVIPELIKASQLNIICETEPSIEGYYYETDEIQLRAEILPANHTYDHVTWTSMDESIATVDENGKVLCIKEGDAHIRCHTHDYSNVAGDFKVHIYKMQEVERLEIKPLDGPLCVTQGNVTLDVTYYPEGATVGSVKWESSDPTVVDVKRGILTPTGWGNAVVTATAPSGEIATVQVTVETGWYVWDSNWGWGNWSCDNVSYTDFGLHAQFNDAGSGKWRNDLKYLNISATNPLPLDWGEYKVIAARIFHLPSGGNANMDAVDAISGINSNNLRPTRIDMSDGSALYIWDAAAKYNNTYTEMRVLGFKIADLPNDRYSSVSEAYYDVKWIRTFKTADDAQTFVEAEIAAGN